MKNISGGLFNLLAILLAFSLQAVLWAVLIVGLWWIGGRL